MSEPLRIAAARDIERATITPAAGSAEWRYSVALISIAILAILAFYAETAFSMVYTWQRSETFAHGFLIVPISLWLIYRKRAILAQLKPRPSIFGLAVLAA